MTLDEAYEVLKAAGLQKGLDSYRASVRLFLDETYPLGTKLYTTTTVFYEPLGEFLEKGTPGQVIRRWSWNEGTEGSIGIQITSPTGVVHTVTENLPDIQDYWSWDPPITIADRLGDPIL